MAIAGLKEPWCAAKPAMAATAVAATAASPARRGNRWSWRKYSGNATHTPSPDRASSTSQQAPTAASHSAAARRERRTRGSAGPAP